jgi:hypothetical protein
MAFGVNRVLVGTSGRGAQSGVETPTRPRAEIESVAALPNIQIERLPKGRLSLHEEFPDEVVSVIRPFLFEETGPF